MRLGPWVERIELVVRLVRSKGVGVYFVTQNPLDVPDTVLGQLGNRVQHALRAFTPRDQKAVKSAADTMRANPGLDIATAITELAVGEALVSLLDDKGRPGVTQRVFVIPPGSQIGPISPEQRQALLEGSLVAGVYEKVVDRESAYEKLKGRTAASPASNGGASSGWLSDLANSMLKGSGRKDSVLETVAKSAARSIGSTVGREIIRGVLGSILGGSTPGTAETPAARRIGSRSPTVVVLATGQHHGFTTLFAPFALVTAVVPAPRATRFNIANRLVDNLPRWAISRRSLHIHRRRCIHHRLLRVIDRRRLNIHAMAVGDGCRDVTHTRQGCVDIDRPGHPASLRGGRCCHQSGSQQEAGHCDKTGGAHDDSPS